MSTTDDIKPDRFFTHIINDDEWTFYLITEEEALELDTDDEEGFAGLTDTDTRCVYVVEGKAKATRNTVTHELYHIHMSYQHIASSDLDADQIEELNAEWLGAMLDKVVAQVNILCKKYNALTEIKEEK